MEQQQNGGNPKPKTNPWTYLDRIFYGIGLDGSIENGRFGNNATNIINFAFDWKIPMYLVQIDNSDPRNRDPNTFSTPSIDGFNKGNISPGANFWFGCDDKDLFATQDKLNEDCYKDPKCNHQALITVLWGTYKDMSFRKDGVMAAFCGIILATCPGGSNFPDCKGQTATLYKDTTQQYLTVNSKYGMLTQMGPPVHSTLGLDAIISEYAKNTHQQITLPNGTLTQL